MTRIDNARVIRAPRGTEMSAKSWLTEAPLRARMGAQARRTVEELFAERAMVERYEAALTELASTRSQREQIRRSAAAH